jgi:group I intron endonuclease
MACTDFKPYGVVYCVEHKHSGMRYVGQTVQKLAVRWQQHQRQSYCVRLYRAIKKFGPEAFLIYELDAGTSKEHLDALEVFYINLLGTLNREIGYNLRGGGSFGKHSDESRKKMSEKVRHAYANTDLRDRRRQSGLGKRLSKCAKELLRQANIGKPMAESTKKILSPIRKQIWSDAEYRARVSAAQKAARADEEYKNKVAINSITQWANPDARAKLLESRAKTQEQGNAARKAAWSDPDKRAARLKKLADTWERKKQQAPHAS